MAIEEGNGGVILHFWVQPRATRDEVAGIQGDAIKIRIAAPPVDGEANDALIRFLSKSLGVSRSGVKILRGETGRRKSVFVAGVSAADARRILTPDP